MRKQLEKAPSFAGWKRYYGLLNDFNKRTTNAQQQAMDAMQNVAAPSMANDAVLAAVRNVERLRLAAERTPSMAAWIAYYRAQEALSKNASSQQIQAAEQMIEKVEATVEGATLSPQLIARIRASGGKMSEGLAAAAEGALERADLQDTMRDLMSPDAQTQRSAVQRLVSMAEEGGTEAGRVLGSAFGRTVRGQILSELGGLSMDTRVTMKDMTEALDQAADSAADNMLSRFKELREQSQALMGQLFQGPHLTGEWAALRERWNILPKPADLMRDIRLQVNQFKNYQRQLANLRKQGAPAGLIQEVTEQGVDALPMLQAIQGMSPAMRQAYFKLFTQSRGLVEKTALNQFNIEVKQWQQQGSNMALAIAAGIQQEDARLRQVFRNMFLQMFGGPAAGKGQVGRPVTVASGNTSITVYAQKGENLEAVMRKALFQFKNRGR